MILCRRTACVIFLFFLFSGRKAAHRAHVLCITLTLWSVVWHLYRSFTCYHDTIRPILLRANEARLIETILCFPLMSMTAVCFVAKISLCGSLFFGTQLYRPVIDWPLFLSTPYNYSALLKVYPVYGLEPLEVPELHMEVFFARLTSLAQLVCHFAMEGKWLVKDFGSNQVCCQSSVLFWMALISSEHQGPWCLAS